MPLVTTAVRSRRCLVGWEYLDARLSVPDSLSCSCEGAAAKAHFLATAVVAMLLLVRGSVWFLRGVVFWGFSLWWFLRVILGFGVVFVGGVCVVLRKPHAQRGNPDLSGEVSQ